MRHLLRWQPATPAPPTPLPVPRGEDAGCPRSRPATTHRDPTTAGPDARLSRRSADIETPAAPQTAVASGRVFRLAAATGERLPGQNAWAQGALSPSCPAPAQGRRCRTPGLLPA